MGKIYQVVVHGLRGEKMMIDLCNTDEQFQNMTVKQLKEKISQRLPETAGKCTETLRLPLLTSFIPPSFENRYTCNILTGFLFLIK
uniref:Ubiquitin-like domain-containing protein n=1 Tax=Pundamilia nyererei TaxID=303518 RepID=A0A3B4FX97_9CICH